MRPIATALALLPLLSAVFLCAPHSVRADGAKGPLIDAIDLPSDVTNGVTTTPDGRVFMVISRLDGSKGPLVVEYTTDGKQTPFPNSTWNSWTAGDDPSNKLVRANSVRVGPDGNLWIVDIGSPGAGKADLPNGPKVVVVDLKTNTVKRVYHLNGPSVEPFSFIDDIRFHGNNGYITDAGNSGAIIVMNLETGDAYRTLVNDKSVMVQHPMMAEHKEMLDENANPLKINADQMEVSPDGKYYYYQACSGPLYRIETQYLDDKSVPEKLREAHRVQFAHNGTTGGTAIDASGNLYVSDTDNNRVLRITPKGKSTVLVADPRLIWVDAMWVDDQGYLWMPSAEQDRMPPQNGGKNELIYPMRVFKIKIDQKPSPIDHS